MNRRLVCVTLCALAAGLVIAVIAVAFGQERRHSDASNQLPAQGHGGQYASPRPPIASPHAIAQNDHLDLMGVQALTRFAFHRENHTLVGGSASYVATVNGGSVAVRPEIINADGVTTRVGVPLQLRTRSVDRTGRVSTTPLSALPYDLQPDGHLIRSRDEAAETLRNSTDGLKQEWEFETMPSGKGDLEIRVATSGEPYVRSTKSGAHFVDELSGLGTVYSNARWIDANGDATDIAVVVEGQELVMRVPEDVVERSTYPATLDPTVGAEFGVDNPVYAPAPDSQMTPAIGHSGVHNSDFLVVWADRRRSLGPNYPFDIFGAHVDASGTVIEPLGFIVSPVGQGGLSGSHTQPAVAWLPDETGMDGTYLVVYANSATLGLQATILQGATSTSPILITPIASCIAGCSHPDIAENTFPDGEKLAVTYADGSDVMVTGFHLTTGSVAFDFPPTSLAVAGRVPVIAGSNGTVSFATHWLVAYQNTTDYSIHGTRVDESGVLSAVGAILPGSVSHPYDAPDVAFMGGTGKWVVVADYDADGTQLFDYDIRANDVSTGGAIGTSINIVNGSSADSFGPSVAGYGSGGTQGYVTWGETVGSGSSSEVRGVRITDSPLGILAPYNDIASTGNIVSGGTVAPVHSDDFSLFFTAWADNRNTSSPPYPEIYGARIDYSGNLLSPPNFPISQSSNAETSPAIALCGSRYLVAWADTRGGFPSYDIYGSILDSTGSVVIQNIAISNASGKQDSPAIGCDGTNFYVVWSDDRNSNLDIYGTGVNATTGAVQSPGGIQLTSTLSADAHPAIAYSPTAGNYLVVWDVGIAVNFAIVSGSTGTEIGSPGVVVRGAKYPDVTWDGKQFWVVYQTTSNSDSNIYANPVTTTGIVGSTIAIEAASGNQRYPRSAFSSVDRTLVVVYEDDRNLATQGTNIFGRRLDTVTGAINGAYNIAATTEGEYAPRIVARDDKTEEVVYWVDPTGATYDFDVYGQTIVDNSLSGSRYVISNQANIREMTPAVACATTASCTAVYRWFDTADATTVADRVKARVIGYP